MWRKIGRLFILTQIILFAEELNFTASVNRTEVGLDEAVILTVSVEGSDIDKIPSPQLPDLPDFDIGGTSSSQSTSIQIINGKFTKQQSINFIYTLYPKKIGELTIGTCKLEFQGKTYTTQPIKITVIKGKTKPARPPSAGPAPSEPRVPISENLKLLASVNRKTIYLGEQVNVEFSLYNRLNLSNLNLTETPSFSGFWVEPIFDTKKINFQKKSINGKLYEVCLLKRAALFPMTTGKLKIGPMKMDAEIVQPPRDFFDFFGRAKVVQLESEPLYITVKPLPETGKPEEFTGGVGRFSISATLDRTTSEAAEPITLTIKITGTGNIRLIEKPKIPPISGVKVLDPETKDNVKIVNNRVKGYKEFRYPLIPQVDGEHLIPSIKIAYFDPRDKKYHTIKTEQLTFTATRTTAAAEAVRAGGLKILGSDINYIKSDRLRLTAQKYSADWWVLLMYLASLIIVGLSLIYRRHQAKLLTDRAYARKLRANKEVRRKIKEAERCLAKQEIQKFYGLLSKILIGYIGDRFNLDTRMLTREQLIEELIKRNVKEELVKRISTVIERCETVRFSPGGEYDEPMDMLQRIKEIIREL